MVLCLWQWHGRTSKAYIIQQCRTLFLHAQGSKQTGDNSSSSSLDISQCKCESVKCEVWKCEVPSSLKTALPFCKNIFFVVKSGTLHFTKDLEVASQILTEKECEVKKVVSWTRWPSVSGPSLISWRLFPKSLTSVYFKFFRSKIERIISNLPPLHIFKNILGINALGIIKTICKFIWSDSLRGAVSFRGQK